MTARKSLPTASFAAMLVLLALGASAAQESPATKSKVTSPAGKTKIASPLTRSKAAQRSPRSPQREAQSPTQVPDLSWLSEAQVRAELESLRLRAGQVQRSPDPNAVVISQSPLPGKDVALGTAVDFTLGKPQLLIDADNATPRANQSVSFSLRFEPALPSQPQRRALMVATASPRYWFDWKDESPLQAATPPTPHAFARPGEYHVIGRAQVGGMPFESKDKAITVGFEEVALEPETTTPQAGSKHQFTARVAPEPAPDANVQYCFDWGNNAQPTCGPSSSAEHAYADPGTFQPRVRASINRIEYPSQPVEIQVRPGFSAQLTGPANARVGEDAAFRVELTPPPAATDKVTYCFTWGTSAEPECKGSPEARHRFDAARRQSVSAYVDVNEQRILAGSLAIGVLAVTPQRVSPTAVPPTPATSPTPRYVIDRLSSRDLLLLAAVFFGGLLGIQGARRIAKIFKVRVTAHGAAPHSHIADAASVSKGPVVRIRCVSPPPLLKLVSPGPVVKGRKEARRA